MFLVDNAQRYINTSITKTAKKEKAMPKGIFERTERHRKQSRINGKRQKGHLPPNSRFHVGMKIGYLTLIERAPIGSARPIQWKLQCACGNIIEKNSQRLSADDWEKHCGCKNVGKRAHNFKGYKDITGGLWSRVLYMAEKRNLECKITIEQAWKLFEKQNRRCALTNLPIGFADGEKPPHHRETPSSASLDRIDREKGYTLDNVQWVHRDVNKIKVDLKQERLVELCRLIVDNASKGETT